MKLKWISLLGFYSEERVENKFYLERLVQSFKHCDVPLLCLKCHAEILKFKPLKLPLAYRLVVASIICSFLFTMDRFYIGFLSPFEKQIFSVLKVWNLGHCYWKEFNILLFRGLRVSPCLFLFLASQGTLWTTSDSGWHLLRGDLFHINPIQFHRWHFSVKTAILVFRVHPQIFSCI